MFLKNLELSNFRNFSSAKIELHGEDAIFLVGNNGQGKTNLLEALYFLSYGSSFKARKEEEVILHGENFYRIKGDFEREGFEQRVEISYANGKKKIKHDNTFIKNRKELLNFFPCLIFKHSDIFFISGSPEYQRQYLDQILVLNHPNYTTAFQIYKQVLQQKNAALKQESFDMIPFYNEQLIENGIIIVEYRKKIIEYINTQIEKMFSYIFGKHIEIRVVYGSSWTLDDKKDKEEMEVEITRKLEDSFEQEKKYRTSVSGPHRDQIKILSDNREFKNTASTGQIRIISLILRSIQATYYYIQQGKPMIYLFDDVLLELDVEKQKRFLEYLPETNQSFFTFLPNEDLPLKVVAKNKKTFSIENGTVKEK